MSLQRRIGPIFRGSVGDTFNVANAPRCRPRPFMRAERRPMLGPAEQHYVEDDC
jgi:hypothetical protein